ncbi:unnamed protein product, partial [Ectocarpus fasciculatus]
MPPPRRLLTSPLEEEKDKLFPKLAFLGSDSRINSSSSSYSPTSSSSSSPAAVPPWCLGLHRGRQALRVQYRTSQVRHAHGAAVVVVLLARLRGAIAAASASVTPSPGRGPAFAAAAAGAPATERAAVAALLSTADAAVGPTVACAFATAAAAVTSGDRGDFLGCSRRGQGWNSAPRPRSRGGRGGGGREEGRSTRFPRNPLSLFCITL